MISMRATVSGFEAVCGECSRVSVPFLHPVSESKLVCFHEDCGGCRRPLFGIVNTTVHCAWCGERFHYTCLFKSPNMTNLWCRLCLAADALSEDRPGPVEVIQ